MMENDEAVIYAVVNVCIYLLGSILSFILDEKFEDLLILPLNNLTMLSTNRIKLTKLLILVYSFCCVPKLY